MADSFSKWGKAISTSEAKRGDIILENSGPGTRTHHVGMATGNLKRDAQGNVTHVEMISGNYGHMVRKNWERVGIIAGMRRGETGGDKPVHVDVTDKSAEKIGHGIARGAARTALGHRGDHLAATQAMLRARHHNILGVDPHSTLACHIRHSIDNSHRQVSMTHAPVFNMQGGDPHAMLADAHRLAGRGQADLVRNMSVMMS